MSKVRLSEIQKEVVTHSSGPLLVVAGPGSGKTRVLTERVRRLLNENSGNCRVLALTFSTKAANEMRDRLKDLGDSLRRTTINTIHGFCLEVLTARGKLIGMQGQFQIFERQADRKQILFEASMKDPQLRSLLTETEDDKSRGQLLDRWLRAIGEIKAYPVSRDLETEDDLLRSVLDTYNGGLNAYGAFDFDDMLLLTYRLFVEHPKVADLYRRIYDYILVDEAQDLNEAQYAVLQALCGDEFKNVMLVGDPKQSIYGFNTASPEYMYRFETDFNAKKIELTENFRSSRSVVRAAQTLEKNYVVEGQLPIDGFIRVASADDEKDEAIYIVNEINRLINEGHPDVEEAIAPGSFAVLARNRFPLIALERELIKQKIPVFKRVSVAYENESEIGQDFYLGMRVYGNPKDGLHIAELMKRWGLEPTDMRSHTPEHTLQFLGETASKSNVPRARIVVQALHEIHDMTVRTGRLNLMEGIRVIRTYADSLAEEERRSVYNDMEVLGGEWDHYLRASTVDSRSITDFLNNVALGSTQTSDPDCVALLTVHSAKGLEFDVVFVMGMVDGIFPDYRSRNSAKSQAEERRSAFVAVTRSKRLLYLTYPRQRTMPWGDIWNSRPSPYVASIMRSLGLVDEHSRA